ncbi:MAG: YggS family pyridoxal phosphate-dependent enzyme [Pseudomonadota bacterium]|nr:YggS family pyridoxal phosphate-dependent enzyme [Pseudomonadota bacterium]
MHSIATALHTVNQQIIQAAEEFNRTAARIQLLAVSKTQPTAAILAAIDCGQRHFGENYLQEALTKIEALKEYPLEWHFIGALQSNKTRAIAEHFQWLHTLDSHKQAQRLNEQRPESLPPLNVCIQVNISEEPQKAGVNLAELTPLAETVAELPRLRLRGLMTLPAYSAHFEQQRRPFRQLHQAYDQLQSTGLTLDTLSMGMTDDMKAAIAEGSTMLRIGTAIFGRRPQKT